MINASLLAARTAHPTLRARAGAEIPHLERVEQFAEGRTWLVAWQPDAPVGSAALRALASGAAMRG